MIRNVKTFKIVFRIHANTVEELYNADDSFNKI